MSASEVLANLKIKLGLEGFGMTWFSVSPLERTQNLSTGTVTTSVD